MSGKPRQGNNHEPLQVEHRGGDQWSVNNNHASLENFDREYVEFGSYFGVYGPQLFAAAPVMLTALQALNAGARPSNWDDDDIDPGEQDAWRQLDAAIAKATAAPKDTAKSGATS